MLWQIAYSILLFGYFTLSYAQETRQVIITQATETSPVQLNCTKMAGSYTWTLDGDGLEGANSSTYNVVNSHKVGRYVCESGDANITYEALNFTKPFISHGRKSITVTEDDTDVELTCTTYSSMPVSFNWMLKKDKMVNLSNSSSPAYSIRSNDTKSVLTILLVTMDTRADYECFAQNMAGAGNATILVRVQSKLAPLWAFLAILAEVAVMAIITLIFSRRAREKQNQANPTESANRNNEPGGSGTQRSDPKED